MPTRAGGRGVRPAKRLPAPPRREAARGRARRAVDALGLLLDALGEAADLQPPAAARHLRSAIVETLGWRARIVPCPSPLAADACARLEDGLVSIPIAPGAGALQLRGGEPSALRRVAELCAHAFARARTHPLESGRRVGARQPGRVLVAGPDQASRRGLVALLGPAFDAVQVDGPLAAAEEAAGGPLDAAVVDLAQGAEGLATLEALRADPAAVELPILALGEAGDGPVRLRAMALGADHLARPCSARELRIRLEQAIRRVRATRALRREALTDPLTGLANRRALEARLHEELRRARRYRTPLACVMADLDHLKVINDSLGHASGDQALQAMASVLHRELRATDLAARVGGDEFLLVLPHTTAGEAVALAERIRRRLASVRVGQGGRARALGASFGVAELGGRSDGQAMVDEADRALYQAKRAGRGRVELAGPERSTSPAGRAAPEQLTTH